MAYTFYSIKNKDKFRFWATETKKWVRPGDRFSKALGKLEELIDNDAWKLPKYRDLLFLK